MQLLCLNKAKAVVSTAVVTSAVTTFITIVVTVVVNTNIRSSTIVIKISLNKAELI